MRTECTRFSNSELPDLVDDCIIRLMSLRYVSPTAWGDHLEGILRFKVSKRLPEDGCHPSDDVGTAADDSVDSSSLLQQDSSYS